MDDDEAEVEGADDGVGDDEEVEVLSDAVSDYAIEVLEQMQDLVEQLDDITHTLGPCFPPQYSIISFYELRYRHWIKGTRTPHSSPPSSSPLFHTIKSLTLLSTHPHIRIRTGRSAHPVLSPLGVTAVPICLLCSPQFSQPPTLCPLHPLGVSLTVRCCSLCLCVSVCVCVCLCVCLCVFALLGVEVTINFHTQDVSVLSKKALLKCVSWMTWYMDRLRAAQLLSSADEDEWNTLMHEMIVSFCQATEQTITALVDNILRAEEAAEAEPNESGHYHTTGPADLFYTINQQMDIVLNAYSLKSHALGHVCLMLADVFTYYQNAQLRFLGDVELDDSTLLFGERRGAEG